MSSAMRKNRGFTLIELLCTMAIGAIILLVAASVLGSSGDGYERVGGGVAAEREARAVINQLTSDLSTAVFHKNGLLEASSAAWAADRIGFLSLQPAIAQTEEKRIGDLCAVNYYLEDLPINGKTVRCLMRGFRESAETFESLANGDITPLFAKRQTADEPIAFGVVSFEARPISRDASGIWTDWIENDTTGPEALEMRVVVARRSLAARLKTPADWDGSPLLGETADAASNKDLEIYSATIRYGYANHETP